MIHCTLPLITLENASLIRYGRTILHNLDWQICSGQHWAIVGPNGSGKSLLMQVVRGRLPVVAGRVVYSSPALPEHISQVSFEQHRQLIAQEQELEIFRQFSHSRKEGTTVAQFLGGLPDAASDGAVSESLQALGLHHLLNTPLLALSNGEMRKTLIARALIAPSAPAGRARSTPRLLILDEPYDGLDASARQHLAETIRLLPAMGVQLLLVTHRLDEISDPITHLLCLKDGRIWLVGEREAVLGSEKIKQLYPAPFAKPTEPGIVGFAGLPARNPPIDTNDEATVVMKNVTVRYGSKVILDRLNWTVRRGENWAILGPNGAGKTTLLRLISADHPQAYANEIYLFGRRRGSGESIWEIKQRIGLLSPELQIRYHRNLSAQEVVLSGFFDSVGLYSRATAEQEALAQRWLQLLGLEELAEQTFRQLAYGHQRMILLARAVVKSPQVLLLDEPCQGLDRHNCQRLNQMVSTLAETGTQILYVTHRPNEIPACITHVLELKLGHP